MLQGLWDQVHGRPSMELGSTQRLIASVVLAVIVGIVSFLSVRLSLLLQTSPDGVAVFWPAAGVVSGVLIALGPNARAPVAVGTIAATICADLLGGRDFELAAISALCGTGDALLVAWLIEYNFGSNFALDNVRRVFGLIAAGAVSAALFGVPGTAGFIWFHNSATPALTIWRHWSASGALGVVAIAPVLIGFASAIRHPPSAREVVEALAAIAAAVIVAWLAVFKLQQPWAVIVPGALLYPIQLMLAARCQPFFGALAAFIVTVAVVCTTTFGLGHFFALDLPIEDRILAAQASILVTSLSSFVLSALFSERRQHEGALSASKAELQAVLNQTPFMLVRCSRDLRYRFISEAYARWRDLRRNEVLGATIMETIGNKDFNTLRPYIEQVLQGVPVDFECEMELHGVGKRCLYIAYRPEFDAAENVEGWIGSLFDVTKRKRAEDHQTELLAELDHRVKNILAQVAAVVTSTRQGSHSIDEFHRSLDGRIRSMTIAHTLLSATGWRSVGLNALASNLLAPYATGTNVAISGTDVVLDAAEIQAVARVLHELATNAAKYGALSIASGQVSVNWDLKANGAAANLTLVWRELGGPPVSSKHSSSYGTTLIRSLIPHELGGTVDLAFAKEGVNCRIEIPVRRA